MATIPSLISQTLDLPPSCIAFCPTQPNIFVVGTYFLHQGENVVINGQTKPWQKRSGSLILFRVEESGKDGAELSIREICTLKTDFAVLDAQWSPHRTEGQEALAVATSGPLVEIYRLDIEVDGQTAKLTESTWVSVEDLEEEEEGDLLALSLAWHPTRSKLLAVTLSNGVVNYLETEGDFAEMGHSFSTNAPSELKHGVEAWTAAFSPTSMGLFSGGDDCALKYLRPNETVDGIEASWHDKRLHGAGVTAILPLSDNLIVTGSYDDHVRLISAPAIGRRQVLADLNLEGGVWRLKVVKTSGQFGPDGPSRSATYTCTILASCMHAGSRVLRLSKDTNNDWGFEVTAMFTEHKSMNYGSDFQPIAPTDGAVNTRIVVSTSFYDKLLCVWRVDMEAAGRAGGGG